MRKVRTIKLLGFKEEQMKIAGIALLSFTIGVIITSVVWLKLSTEVSYQFVIGKLIDNVTFYRQIESGKPELTQKAIESSLDWFIKLAEDGQNSIWVEPAEIDKQILVRAKALNMQIMQSKEPLKPDKVNQ